MRLLITTVALIAATGAYANDWQKFYTPVQSALFLAAATVPPEVVPTAGDIESDVRQMWRRGFGAVGYSSFNSPNSKVSDAVKWAGKLKARYVVVATQLSSSTTASIPITVPTSTTSVTNGQATAYGSGGYASGNYSGTTTTYGSQTSYIPFTVNRFNKMAVYFAAVEQKGSGALVRELNQQEVTQYETQRGFVIRAIRDGSPAYASNLLPGDVVLHVNGQPADMTNWQAAIRSKEPITIQLIRNGQDRELLLNIPTDWRPSDAH